MAFEIKNVAVIGLGNLGAMIAVQAAASGYKVTGFDLDKTILKKTIDSCMGIDQSKMRQTPVDVAKWSEAVNNVAICDSLIEAVSEADLVIEAVPERLELKHQIWREMDQAAPTAAILATNSSSLPVSKLEDVTSRPDKCLNMHFYRPEMGINMADVMGGTKTSLEVLETGKEFVKSIGMVPLTVKKELLGFCFNRIWRTIKREALYMWAGGFVDFRDIDRAYMIFNGTPWGPFGLMDSVGLDVVWDIEMVYYKESNDPKDKPPQALKDLIDKGQLGAKTGQGFYTYPGAEYQQEGFLNP